MLTLVTVCAGRVQVLDQVVAQSTEVFGEDILAAFPLLSGYKARFETLPAVVAYRATPAFSPRPFNNKVYTHTHSVLLLLVCSHTPPVRVCVVVCAHWQVAKWK